VIYSYNEIVKLCNGSVVLDLTLFLAVALFYFSCFLSCFCNLLLFVEVIMDLRQMKWSGMNWTDLAQDRDEWRVLLTTVTNFRFLLNIGEVLE
jgi:hypothetical protein